MSESIVEALELPYGTIVGDGATVHADGSDANPHPDVDAFDNVRVIFTPSDGNGRRVNTVIWTGVDGPTILHPQIETGRFEGGRLVLDVPTPPQPDGMRLMATVSDDMVPNSWGWKMEWTGWPSGKGPGPVIFPLEPGATVDIAEALAGYLDEVPAVDFANLLAAADEVMQARAEVQQISGLTGEDSAVALLVDTPASDTGAAVRAVASSTPAPATDASVATLASDRASSTGAAIRELVGHVSVRDFGAMGDGIADDGAAIMAALAAAGPGATIRVPTGTYRTTIPIICAKSVSIVGDGAGVSVIRAASNFADVSLVRISAAVAGFGVAGITLDGNKDGQAAGHDLICLDLSTAGANGVSLSGVTIRNSPYHGAYLNAVTNATFTDCQFLDNGHAEGGNGHAAGVYAALGANVAFSGCTFERNFEHGVYGGGGVGYYYVNCRFIGNGAVGLSARSSATTVSGAYASGNGAAGIEFSSTYGKLTDIRLLNSTIVNNLGPTYEVGLTGEFSGVYITGNTIDSAGKAGSRGLQVQDLDAAGGGSVSITGNAITAAVPLHIRTTNAGKYRCNQNTCTGPLVDIFSGALDSLEITGNTIDSEGANTAAPIQIRAATSVGTLAVRDNVFLNDGDTQKRQITVAPAAAIAVRRMRYAEAVVTHQQATSVTVQPGASASINVPLEGYGYSGVLTVSPQNALPAGVTAYAAPAQSLHVARVWFVNAGTAPATIPGPFAIVVSGVKTD